MHIDFEKEASIVARSLAQEIINTTVWSDIYLFARAILHIRRKADSLIQESAYLSSSSIDGCADQTEQKD